MKIVLDWKKKELVFKVNPCKIYTENRHINEVCHNKQSNCWGHGIDKETFRKERKIAMSRSPMFKLNSEEF